MNPTKALNANYLYKRFKKNLYYTLYYTNCITIKNKCVFKYVSWLVAVKEYIFFRQTDTHTQTNTNTISLALSPNIKHTLTYFPMNRKQLRKRNNWNKIVQK